MERGGDIAAAVTRGAAAVAEWGAQLPSSPDVWLVPAAVAALAMLVAVTRVRRRRIIGRAPAIVDAPVLASPRTEVAPPILCNGRRTAGSEAFRVLRTQMLLLVQERRLRHLLITSSGPGEGKSTVAANLAVATARAGHRVLLVDADLHRPRLAGLFRLPDAPGLGELLSRRNGESLETAIRRCARRTGVPNLAVLPAGAVRADTAEMFAGAAMRDLVAALAGAYELIVFDSPPVLSVADPTILAAQVDGVLMVVRVGCYPREAVSFANAELQAVSAHVLGVVLNGVESGADGAYYGHYRYPYYA